MVQTGRPPGAKRGGPRGQAEKILLPCAQAGLVAAAPVKRAPEDFAVEIDLPVEIGDGEMDRPHPSRRMNGEGNPWSGSMHSHRPGASDEGGVNSTTARG